MPRSRQYRKRPSSASDSSQEDVKSQLEMIKLVQRLRQHHQGINPDALAFGHNYPDRTVECPQQSINMRTGGFIDVRKVRARDLENMMQGNFARETNHRAEDIQMERFIESELKRRKVTSSDCDETCGSEGPVEDLSVDGILYGSMTKNAGSVSRHLLTDASTHKSEEMLSEQMLSGIPEVDLGVDEKKRNIEETEKLKQKLLTRLKERKTEDISLVPQNMAVNFVQHRRYTTDLVQPIQHDELIAQYGAKLAAVEATKGSSCILSIPDSPDDSDTR